MNWMERVREAIHKPASRWKRFMRDVLIDVVVILVSLWFAYALAFNNAIPADQIRFVYLQGAILGVTAVVLLLWRGLYSINVRYIGLGDFLNIALVGGMGVLGLFVLQRLHPVIHASRSVLLEPLLFGFLAITLLTGIRIARRIYSWRTVPHNDKADRIKPKRTLIVGAGDAGEMIMREIARSPHPHHRVVGFVDDDPDKSSLRIHGSRVLGTTERIPFLVEDLDIEEILIALPSVSGENMRRINNLCQGTTARVRTLPPVKNLLNGGPHLFTHLRKVDIEDLLRREPVQTDLDGISSYLSGERVLITGGGGSIGSELARQISNFSPASLILLGKGENSIYEIEQELLQTNRFHPTCVVADVRDRQSMAKAFDKHKPTVVFHAAAHKHVPLMQDNPIEAIRNNVWGTWLTAELAIKQGAKRFIYVSTDKAVKPSSIMGATKRVGEMLVSSLGHRSETEFGIVRFGNVMGSRGSLIPLLKAQIARGGPVRVTHKDMTRYFMTIPEAVQLILQTGSMGERGEIFLLDMGEPIKILDLASDLIRLHGLVPGEDIEIQFSGVRPGEKIHEEL
ncbi:MAG TPA: nucleoside-diphosphate sugar epimerase/dehydratase, partial [Fimbriimonadaceae bacterium]|nr:nucleoside-diphosphate sugar epimerase/dehydratase [Fimbriimonadaceae bacterium]